MAPEKWQQKTLDQVAVGKLTNGAFNDPKMVGKGYRLINVVDLYNPFEIDVTRLKRLDLPEKDFQKYQVSKGDLLFTRSSLKLEGIAQCARFTQECNDVIFDCHIMRLRPNKALVDSNFLYEYCSSYPAKKHFMRFAKTGTMTTIDQAGISTLIVPTPPLPEQKKIAQILSTWDQAITATERLLENSQQRKKGLMQQLLTGKKRLPGFEGEWEEGRLGDLCKFRGGSAFKEIHQGSQSGELPFIKVSDMNLPGNEIYIQSANNWVSQNDAKAMRAKSFPEGSIVFAKVGAALLLNRRRILTRATIIDNNMMAALPEDNASRNFLYQVLLMIDFAKFVQDGAVPSINQSDLSSFKIKFPSLKEQTHIAEILDKSDEEVAQLQKLIDRLKQEKKALMQQLLTGKRRVQVETEAA
ncbi:restriction endonuclease subunit S [Vreelandella alkaliphila]|uniref:restriction endonuclease subunit S n=1 Tax=Vreelandella alkaliphila TaxID=272774 RepID=UPI00232FEC10|nr:restriction endonuclease subunit S [Halomonas alkaliphila]